MVILIFFFAHWYLSLFTQTFFHHRYAAHRMFTMSRGMEKFFFWLSWLFQGSSYLSPYSYGILHRQHHAFADTENDPHSPKYSKNLFHMMWLTKKRYEGIFSETTKVDPRFLGNLPKWKAFDKFADSWFNRIFWGTFYVAFYAIFATSWWMWLLLPIQFVMGPFHGAIINWFAHKIGYRSNKVNDTSTNLLAFDFLMLGEGYHNNHHSHPERANFGLRWHEFDPVYPVIKAMAALKLIRMRKPEKQHVRKAA